MIWPTKPIIEEEFSDNEYELFKRFINNEENLHNGTTFIFESKKNEVVENKDNRYFQFKTIIEEDKQNYFIYDEVIQINEKPILLLRIHNDETREIWEQMIYLENNKVVEQIRCLTYQQFFSELENNEKIVRIEEDSSTTIISTPFLEFIENINQEKNEFNKQKPMKKNDENVYHEKYLL